MYDPEFLRSYCGVVLYSFSLTTELTVFARPTISTFSGTGKSAPGKDDSGCRDREAGDMTLPVDLY